MMRVALSHSYEAPAAAEGGSDHRATESHYLTLANRIVSAWGSGGYFVLITSDPPAIPHLLSQALRNATKSAIR
jgi:hypothetical protein